MPHRVTLPLPAVPRARTSGVAPPIPFQSFRTSLAAKFGAILAAVFFLSLAALFLFLRVQQQARADLLTSEIRERSRLLADVIDLTTRRLRDFTEENAQWDEMVRFVDRPNLRWAAVNIDASLDSFELSGAWVLRPDGSLVYAARRENSRGPTPLPLTEAAIRTLLAKPPDESFFVQLPGELAELYLAPVQPSDDALLTDEPRGWLLAQKNWDAAQIRLLSKLTRCEGRIAPPGEPLPPPEPHQITLRHPLPGPGGGVTADYLFTLRAEELEITARHLRSTVLVFAATSLMTAVLLIGSLYAWVLRPLGAIGNSLARNDPGPTGLLAHRSDEMGRLARLVEASFEQRLELERMLAERARLGRDLHDGTIQTVYAAGMTLAGVRSTLRTNPDDAERAIDGIRATLNTTIRDLRAFIDDLEPEPERPIPFSQATRDTLALMQGVRPFGFTLQIDDPLADRLSGTVRLHLLQIIRESASNYVRHSRAENVQIILRRVADTISLEIVDDGEGIAFSSEAGSGRGRVNLSERTRELGGHLRFESTPGKGTQLTLTFPFVVDAPN